MIFSKKLLMLAAIGLVAIGIVLFSGERRISQDMRSEPRKAWVIEDGIVAWRPMGTLEKAAATVFSLGTAIDEDWVQGRTMPEADVTSFRALSANYGVDRHSVWHRGESLANADPHSFQVAAYGFARDANFIWQGSRRIRPNPTTIDAEFTAYSEAVYSLGQQGYYMDKALPEMPEGNIIAYCRDWYQMNNALWLAEKRVVSLSETAQPIVCDGTVLTTRGAEDLTENKGIVLAEGSAVMMADLKGQIHLLHRFNGKISQSGNVASPFSEPDLMLLQLADGDVYLADYQIEDGQVQHLGRYEKLDFGKARAREGELWLGNDLYFIKPDRVRAAGRFARRVGPADVKGEYVIAGERIYRFGRLIARSNSHPVEFLDQSRLQIGPMCIQFGNYISDLPTKRENDEITLRCNAHRPPAILHYDGLNVGFEKEVVALEVTQDGLVEYDLGTVFIQNTTSEARMLRSDFVRSVRFFVESAQTPQLIKVEYPAMPKAGTIQIGPKESVRWAIVLRAPKDLKDVFYFLQLSHMPERSEVLLRDQHRFAYGVVELSAKTVDQ